MGLEQILGFSIPVRISYFNPSTDWFDLGILMVMVGILITFSAHLYYNFRLRRAPRRLKLELHNEVRWWFSIHRSLMGSLIFAVVVKCILIIAGIDADY